MSNTMAPGAPEPTPPTSLAKTSSAFYKDLAERALSTFWQGALATFITAQPITNWSELKTVGTSAAVAGIAALASVAKSYFVRYSGVINSASGNKSV